MIAFKILSSPDFNGLGDYSHFHPLFTFGSSPKAFFTIKDRNILGIHLKCKAHEKGIIATGPKDIFYLVNNKKVSGSQILRENDLLTLGETTIKFTQYNYQTISHPIVFDELYTKALESDDRTANILEAIEYEFLYLND
jgi:hypothetical protein